MKNLDFMQEKRISLMDALAEAIKANDTDATDKAVQELSQFYAEVVNDQINGVMESVDRTILAGRGVRQLTSAETQYFQAFINAAKASDPKQAIANIDKAFPETTIDAVLEDMAVDHELLGLIDFQNTTLITKFIKNAKGIQAATWGPINGTITTELEGAIDLINMAFCKATAFMFVTKDMLEAGPAWVERYSRAVLVDALAVAMEVATISGTGKDMPIGMIKKDEVESSTKEYKDMDAITVNDFSPETIGKLTAGLAVTDTGRPRTVKGLVLVVSPRTYFEKVVPATTLLCPDGHYAKDVLPVDCKIVQSVAVNDVLEKDEEGKPTGKVTKYTGIFGIAKNYLLGAGLPKGGKLEYSDDFKFLDDVRTFKIKFLGNGMPKDWNSFRHLNLTGLKPLEWPVKKETPTA